jgi:hypothetical protein
MGFIDELRKNGMMDIRAAGIVIHWHLTLQQPLTILR